MTLQSQLSELFLAAEKPFNDGSDRPYYAITTLTQGDRRLRSMKIPNGQTQVSLEDVSNEDYGFQFYGTAEGIVTSWHAFINGKKKIYNGGYKGDRNLETYNDQNPQEVEQSMQGLSTDVSTLTQNVEMIYKPQKYDEDAMTLSPLEKLRQRMREKGILKSEPAKPPTLGAS